MSQIAFELRQILHRMWFLPAAFSLLAVITVLIAYLLAGFAPEELPFTMPSNGVEAILTILASSLLTVSVFALSTIVAALASASVSTTPRAVPLIVGDRSAQTSISVFIGAFLFSIVGIIGLNTGVYSQAGRLFLFGVTLLVLLLVIMALIRWIGQISAIGRVSQTIDKVEHATVQAFDLLADKPHFGCRPLKGAPKGHAITTASLGYVQHFDASRLQRLAEEHDVTIAVNARPGAFASPNRPLMLVSRELGDEAVTALVDCFTIGGSRTFESDPRFGLVVLSEIASRALSTGVNDSGTAIDVLGTLVRILHHRRFGPSAEDAHYDRIYVEPIDPVDVFEDAFRPIARDGAGTIEVVLRMLVGLRTLAAGNPALTPVAAATARDVTERARLALTAPSDLLALEQAATFAH